MRCTAVAVAAVLVLAAAMPGVSAAGYYRKPEKPFSLRVFLSGPWDAWQTSFDFEEPHTVALRVSA